MPNKHQPQPPEHPQEAANRAAQADREQNAKAIQQARAAPHPTMAIANALGTEPHRIDREAFQQYQAGHPKKAERAQQAANTEAVERTTETQT